MTERPQFTAGVAAVAALCAILDTAAISILVTAPDTVRMCGAGWLLPGILLVAMMTYGVVILLIGLTGVALAYLAPFLRSRRLWLVSSLVLSALAVLVALSAIAAYPVPSDPMRCVI